MTEQTVNWNIIEEWIHSGLPFAFYRLPDQDMCHGIRQHAGQPEVFEDIAALNGREGFVFVPFRVDKEHSLYLLSPDEVIEWKCGSVSPDIPPSPEPVPFCGKLETVPSAEYAADFGCCLSALREGRLSKVVLSRMKQTPRPAAFSVGRAFRAACLRYVHSYVYLFYTPQTGMWLGATPEILLAGEKGGYRTVALAGTQAMTDGVIPSSWDEKNRREQQYVTDYLLAALREKGIEPVQNGPFTVTAGSLAHLKTELDFSLEASDMLGCLLQTLHPTPAVCGLPKADAYAFVCGHEHHERAYYAGFLGMLSPYGRTDLYVNLRCMRIESGRICCFAGGGLLASSVLEYEWMETEKKLQTMKYVIQKGME